MKVPILYQLFALLFIWAPCLCMAESADQQLLTAMDKHVEIDSPGAKPFQLDASFTAQINVPVKGHLIWKWVNKELWSQEITMGDYRQLSLRKGNTLYLSRNVSFTPVRITELQGLLNISSPDADYWQTKKIRHQAQDGIEMECAEIRALPRRHAWNPKRTLCIDPATKEILTDETKDEDEQRREEFLEYQPFGEYSYPRHMKLFVNGSTVLDVEINSLHEGNFDESTFVPLPGAIARRQCEHMIPPKVLKDPEPPYPRSAAENRMGGTVIAALTILPDGSVSDVQLAGRAEHEMDQVTQAVLKTWKFQPAMCGNEPVTFDIHVEVNFRMQ